MTIKAGRIAVAVLAAEILGVLCLVALVAIFGPADAGQSQAYAEKLGFWVGPISGFVLCVLGGLWVARRLEAGHVVNGLILGLAAAALDVAILIAAGAPFKLIYAVSNAGRVAAGALGGWLASRDRSPP